MGSTHHGVLFADEVALGIPATLDVTSAGPKFTIAFESDRTHTTAPTNWFTRGGGVPQHLVFRTNSLRLTCFGVPSWSQSVGSISIATLEPSAVVADLWHGEHTSTLTAATVQSKLDYLSEWTQFQASKLDTDTDERNRVRRLVIELGSGGKLSWSQGEAYTYDGAGNLTKNSTTAFTYNQAQQMTKALRGGVTTDYTYAGADQKAVLSESVSAGTEYRTVYGKADGNGNPQIVTYTGGNSSSHVFSDPVTGQASLLTTSTDVVSMYLWDGLGNPVGLLTDGASNPVLATYDPNGLRALTAANSDTGVAQNPYAFKAGIYDRGTGLVKFGLRWYDVATGAWTQQDTLDAPLDPGNANRYGFAANDPVNNTDPTGKNACGQNIAGAVGATIGIGLAVGGIALAASNPVTLGAGLAATATLATSAGGFGAGIVGGGASIYGLGQSIGGVASTCN